MLVIGVVHWGSMSWPDPGGFLYGSIYFSAWFNKNNEWHLPKQLIRYNSCYCYWFSMFYVIQAYCVLIITNLVFFSVYSAGMQGMPGADMYGASPNSYSQMPQLRPPVHSQAMLIPGHPHAMMMAHGGHMGHPGMHGLPTAQSPPLHGGMDTMGHIQDIHAG